MRAPLTRHARYLVVGAGIVVLLATLIHDLFRQSSRPSGSVTSGPYGNLQAPHSAELQLRIDSLDRTARVVQATLTVDVTGRTPFRSDQDRIRSAIVMIEDGDIRVPRRARAPFKSESTRVVNGIRRAHVQSEFGGIALATVLRPEVFYPFDKFRIVVVPDGCVNLEDCPAGNGVRIDRVTVLLSEQVRRSENLILTGTRKGNRIEIEIVRQLFLRTVTVYFVVVLVVFLVHLYRLQQARDLLVNAIGLLAAIWGFREIFVPNGVQIFPTLIDHIVLLAFGVVFLLIVTKLPTRRPA